MSTYYSNNLKRHNYPTITQDMNTSFLIVGGGLCGLLLAYKLEELNLDYILVEANMIAERSSGNNTGKITAQHGLIYNKLLNEHGIENARAYLKANLDAIEEYRTLAKNMHISFHNQDAYCFSTNNEEALRKEVKALNELGYDATYVPNPNLPFKNVGAVKFKNQASYNPVAFATQIAKDLNIYENTTITNIKDDIAYTKDGYKIKAKKIIITTNFPFIDSAGFYFMKMYQERLYGIVLDNVEYFDGMYVDEEPNGLSFRFHEKHLIIYGGDERCGCSEDYFKQARTFAKHHFPTGKEIATISNEDSITLDNLPCIGRYTSLNDHLLIATGFNKWGNTLSMVAANMLRDMLINKKHPLEELFNPLRLPSVTSLASNALEATINYLRPTTKRCTHLGCGLVYNPEENSWDCPCHGSRFNEKGEVINGPATKNLQ